LGSRPSVNPLRLNDSMLDNNDSDNSDDIEDGMCMFIKPLIQFI